MSSVVATDGVVPATMLRRLSRSASLVLQRAASVVSRTVLGSGETAGADADDAKSMTPLEKHHVMLTHGSMAERAQASRSRPRSRRRRLHDAVLSGISDVDDPLLTAAGSRQCDAFDLLALHCAAMSNENSLDVVAKLIELNRDALSAVDKNGKLPLHYAAAYSNSEHLLALLLAAAPAAARTRDRLGALPIHLAAQLSSSMALLAALVAAWPGGLMEPDKWGRLPLHMAAKGNRSAVAVASLIAACPEALDVADKDGDKPGELVWRYPDVVALFESAATVSGLARIKTDPQKVAARISERTAAETELTALSAPQDPRKVKIDFLEDAIARAHRAGLPAATISEAEAKLASAKAVSPTQRV